MLSTKNFAEYRESLHMANPPCIPFFGEFTNATFTRPSLADKDANKFSGVYLTDLTFIEDGIPSIIKKTTLINFAKRAKTADVIRDIQQYQNVPYSLQPVTELQDYILSNMQAAGDVHEMYDKSLLIEPREREDEKIVRYVATRDQQITSGRMILSGWLLKPAVSVSQPNLALPLRIAFTGFISVSQSSLAYLIRLQCRVLAESGFL